MRNYQDILNDIEKNMTDNHLTRDLESLRDWQKQFKDEAGLCSGIATWLYTFQVYGNYNEATADLIDEFGYYCDAKGIRFI